MGGESGIPTRGCVSGIPYDEDAASPYSYPRTFLPSVYRQLQLGQSLFYYCLKSKATSSTDQSAAGQGRSLIITKSSSEVQNRMTKALILVFGALLLFAKGKGAIAVEEVVPGGKELFSEGGEGVQGFEGRQLSSLAGNAPWLQGAGHLLRIFLISSWSI